ALLVRDRMGVKPLYFHKSNTHFYFASEIKALSCIPDISKEVDVLALEAYVSILSAPTDHTPYEAIKKLLPGTCLSLDLEHGHVQEYRFWQLPIRRSYITDTPEYVIKTAHALLIDAVKRQLQADVPLGFFLSGGLDSSLLVAIAQKHGGIVKPTCFTMKQDTNQHGFENDYPYAELLAKALNLDLTLVVKKDLDLRAIDAILDIIEEPVPDLSALNIQSIAQQAQAAGLKVLISGLGADDVATGYRRHLLLAYHGYLRHLPLKYCAALLHKLQLHNGARWLEKLVMSMDKDLDVFIANLHLYTNPQTSQMREMLVAYLKTFDNSVHPIDKALALEQYSYLPNQNLLYTDKVAMRYGVEVRVPYLDNELMDYLYRIPHPLKIKGFETKYILKEIAKEYLPKSIIYRTKVGFSEPITTTMAQLLYHRLSPDQRLHLPFSKMSKQLLLNLYAVSKY
ncbi:MAG TPA: asparagine synthase-related protein, partial [Cytophagales bacterium]|nr:asparagine synthase-related protein [Cytophagales bacterium]